MIISHYQFGKMVINNHTYTNDLIIYGQNVFGDWFREKGHQLTIDDLSQLPLDSISDIIVGTGYYGFLKVHTSVIDYCDRHNITLKPLKTAQAVDMFNDWYNKKTHLAGAFHLSC
jgi:hypothetical protein